MNKHVLVVAAHPDDEILGCGGTLSRHAAEGCEINLLILAEGATSRDEWRQIAARAAEIDALRDAAHRAAGVIGAAPPSFGGFADNRMDSVALLDVIKVIERKINEVKPDIVYTHHGGDLNIDHRIVHEAVVTACRPLPDAVVRAIYAFETISSTEWALDSSRQFRPVRWVDISDFLARKMEALACYDTEMRPFPHPRSREGVEALARMRGATAGVSAAEAFSVVREIVR